MTPGFSRVPHDFVFETDAPGYRFWLVSRRGLEPLDLVPGHPFRVDGAGRDGSHRPGQVIAAPVGLADRLGEAELTGAVDASKRPPGVLVSEPFDFYGSVPFFDSRSRVVDRYRVEVGPENRIRLVRLEHNAGSAWVKVAWAVAGICLVVGTFWAGWWTLRRVWRVAAPKPTA